MDAVEPPSKRWLVLVEDHHDGQHVQPWVSTNGSSLPHPIPLYQDGFSRSQLNKAMRPRWANDDFFWLAFVPRDIIFKGRLFEPLKFPVSLVASPFRLRNGSTVQRFKLSEEVCRKWSQLEIMLNELRSLLSFLLGSLPLTIQSPPAPSEHGYEKYFADRKSAYDALDKARWSFILQMTYVSCLDCLLPSSAALWRQIPDETKIALQASWMFADDPPSPRVGAFVDTTQSGQWLKYFDIISSKPGLALWLHYPTDSTTPLTHPTFQRYTPTKDQIDSALKELETHRQHRPSDTHIIDPSAPKPHQGSGQKQGQNPEAYFAERDALLQKVEAAETVLQKELRVERARRAAETGDAPAHGSVWVWEEQDEWCLRRFVGKAKIKETWNEYGPTQRRYDQVSGQWDLWTGFDPAWQGGGGDSDSDSDSWPTATPHEAEAAPALDGSFSRWPARTLSPGRSPSSTTRQRSRSPYSSHWQRSHRERDRNNSPRREQDRSRSVCRWRSPRRERGQSRSPDTRRSTGRWQSPRRNQGRSCSPQRRQSHRRLDEQDLPPSAVHEWSRFPYTPNDHRLYNREEYGRRSPPLSPGPRHPSASTLAYNAERLSTAFRTVLSDDEIVEDAVAVEPILTILRCRYGFKWDTSYVPGKFAQEKRIKNSAKFMHRILGFDPKNDEIPAAFVDAVDDFVGLLVHGFPLPNQLCDLMVEGRGDFVRALGSPMTVEKAKLEVLSGVGPQDVYLIKPRYVKDAEDWPWHLVVESPLTAAEILRRRWGVHKTSVVRELVKRGIPFRTMLPIPQKSLSLPPPAVKPGCLDVGLGVREPNFRTSKEEYMTYEDQRRDLLISSPHAILAALGAGGIIWRLTVGTLQPDLAVEGPRGGTDHQATVSLDGKSYVCDAFTSHEEDLICGVYRVLARKLSHSCQLIGTNVS